jgi:drug/metabolite transporter (DMT)-like permease
MKSSPKTLPYLALGAGVLALSFTTLFIRWSEAPGAITQFYRMGVATVFLLPFTARQRNVSQPGIKFLILLPMATALFSALDNALLSTSLAFTRIANATLLNNMAPLWVAIFAIVFWKEKINLGFWAGLVLAFAGAATVLGTNILEGPGVSKGNIMALISSIFYAGYFLITQVARTKLNTLTYIFMVDLFAVGFLFLINLGMGNSFGPYPPATWVVFLLAGLISQVGGYFSIGYALGHLPASVVSPTLLLQPVITAMLAIPLFGETLSTGQIAGGLAALGGIYLLNISRMKPEESGMVDKKSPT